MSDLQKPMQSEESIRKNSAFFLEHIDSYDRKIGELDTYRRIRTEITQEVAGVKRLLDVGNGGVFDYDTSVVEHVVGIDLFLDKLPPDRTYPGNVVMEAGDALSLPKADASYDGVLMAMLLHHLIGDRVAGCIANLDRAIAEAARVLRPGGKLVVVESCVPSWFYRIERAVFRMSVPVINRLLSHPPAFQHTVQDIRSVIALHMGQTPTVRLIPKDQYVIQFGFTVPSWITPVQPYVFVAHKQ